MLWSNYIIKKKEKNLNLLHESNHMIDTVIHLKYTTFHLWKRMYHEIVLKNFTLQKATFTIMKSTLIDKDKTST